MIQLLQQKGTAMKLIIGGIERTFIPLKVFRQQAGLPESFGVGYFEPKDFGGLAAIDHAGTDLNMLRQTILDAFPASLTLAELIPFFDRLQVLFDNLLRSINARVGLKPQEIEFAVAGFGDVNQMLTYALIRSRRANLSLPDFEMLYQEWLSDSVRVSARVHDYPHQGQQWQIQIINHVYGRVGLIVNTGANVHYVHDTRLACPAEGYMMMMLAEIGTRVMERLV